MRAVERISSVNPFNLRITGEVREWSADAVFNERGANRVEQLSCDDINTLNFQAELVLQVTEPGTSFERLLFIASNYRLTPMADGRVIVWFPHDQLPNFDSFVKDDDKPEAERKCVFGSRRYTPENPLFRQPTLAQKRLETQLRAKVRARHQKEKKEYATNNKELLLKELTQGRTQKLLDFMLSHSHRINADEGISLRSLLADAGVHMTPIELREFMIRPIVAREVAGGQSRWQVSTADSMFEELYPHLNEQSWAKAAKLDYLVVGEKFVLVRETPDHELKVFPIPEVIAEVEKTHVRSVRTFLQDHFSKQKLPLRIDYLKLTQLVHDQFPHLEGWKWEGDRIEMMVDSVLEGDEGILSWGSISNFKALIKARHDQIFRTYDKRPGKDNRIFIAQLNTWHEEKIESKEVLFNKETWVKLVVVHPEGEQDVIEIQAA